MSKLEAGDTDSKKRKQKGSPPQTPTSTRAAKRRGDPGSSTPLDLGSGEGAVSSVQPRTTSQPTPDEFFSHPGPAPLAPSAAGSLPLAPPPTVMALARPFKASYSPAYEAFSLRLFGTPNNIQYKQHLYNATLKGDSVLKSVVDHLNQPVLTTSELFRGRDHDFFNHLLNRDDDLSNFLDDLPTAVKALRQNLHDELANKVFAEKAATLYNFLCGEPLFDQSSDTEDPQIRQAIHQAWTVPYRGHMHHTLLRTIRTGYCCLQIDGGGFGYSNTVTILQSEGTGKSRMVHEMRHRVFTIPFNLRQDKHTDHPAFPPPDKAIRAYMTADVPNEAVFKNRCYFMFRVLFNFIRRWLKIQQPGLESYEEAVHAWNVFADSKRSEIYDAIGSVLVSKPPPPDRHSGRATTQLFYLCHALRIQELPHDIPSPDDDAEGDLPDVFHHILSAEDREECNKRVQQDERNGHRLTPRELASTVILVVYFDDAHVLANKTPTTPSMSSNGTRKTLYEHLLSVFNDFQIEPIFGVFPSHSLHIPQFPPPPTLSSSARYAESNRLKAPITEVPFDCGPLLPLQSNADLALTIQSVSSVYFMAQFGRPLFWTMMYKTHDAANVDVDGSTREKAEFAVMRLAQAKLAGRADIDLKDWREYGEDARLAVLDVRLCFDYETRKAVSANHEATLVASHMRLAYSVPGHRQYIRSGYSSEPILAEAAATLMRRWMENSNDTPEPWNPLDSLAQFVDTGLIRRGDHGELVARYILMRAYDAGVVSEKQDTANSWWLSSSGCSVDSFVRALFQGAIADEVLSCVPDNVSSGETFSAAFARSSVRFTCFVKLGDSSGLSPEGLCAAFTRGVGFIGHGDGEDVDVILPVLVDRTRPITPDNMSCILIQIKARLRGGHAGACEFTAEDVGVFGSGGKRGYVRLVMELGVEWTKSQLWPCRVDVGAEVRDCGGMAGFTAEVHPRYNIRAYGCSSTVYKVMDRTEKEKYRGLLLGRHPAGDQARSENVEDVWNMKPIWMYGKVDKIEVDSYLWYGRPPE